MLPATLVTIASFLLKFCSSSPVYSMQPAYIIANIGTTGRNIRNLPCISRKTNEKGVCMFAIDCLKANGTHLGTCIDRFYFGSCCHIEPMHDIIGNTIDTAIIPSRQPPSRVSSTTAKISSSSATTEKTATTHSSTLSTPKLTRKPVVTYNVTLTTTTFKPKPSFGEKLTTIKTTAQPSSPSSSRLPTKSTTEASVAPTTEIVYKLTTFQTVEENTVNGEAITTKPTTQKLQPTSKPTLTRFTTSRPSPPTAKPTSTPFRPRPTHQKPTIRPPRPQTTTTKPVKITKPTLKVPISTRVPIKPTKPTKITTHKKPVTITRPVVTTTTRPTTLIRITQKPTISITTTKKPTFITHATEKITLVTEATTKAPTSTTKSTTWLSTTKQPSTKVPSSTTVSTVATTTSSTTTTTSSTITTTTGNMSTTQSNDLPVVSSFLESVNGNPATNEIEQVKPLAPPPTTEENPSSLVTWALVNEETTSKPTTLTQEWMPITTPDGWVLLPSLSSTLLPGVQTTTSAPLNNTERNETSSEKPLEVFNTTTTAPFNYTTESSSTVNSSSTTMSTAEVPIVSSTITNLIDASSTTERSPANMSDFTDVCGRRMYPEARIVGGERATFGKWPWQISLRQWRTSTYLHKCGAALLNENWAITAAHCVDNVPPSDLLLRLGEHDLSTDNEPYIHQERRVQIVASHPQFDPRTFEYDLALLRFYEPVQFQPNIIPVCVPNADENFVGRTAYVTGWGRLYEDGPLPSVLQEVAVPVINNTVCESMYRSAGYIEHIPHIFICAGWRRGGFDSCEGDSGGPMVIQRPDKRFLLAGVISWGIGCAEPNQPGVYTRISEFRDWINQILQF